MCLKISECGVDRGPRRRRGRGRRGRGGVDRSAAVGPHPISKSLHQTPGELDTAAAADWEAVTGAMYTGHLTRSQTQHQGKTLHSGCSTQLDTTDPNFYQHIREDKQKKRKI